MLMFIVMSIKKIIEMLVVYKLFIWVLIVLKELNLSGWYKFNIMSRMMVDKIVIWMIFVLVILIIFLNRMFVV